MLPEASVDVDVLRRALHHVAAALAKVVNVVEHVHVARVTVVQHTGQLVHSNKGAWKKQSRNTEIIRAIVPGVSRFPDFYQKFIPGNPGILELAFLNRVIALKAPCWQKIYLA